MRLRHPIPGAPWGAPYGWRGAVAGLPAGLHNGQDFPAGTGTRVYAAADGTAYRRWEGGGFGNYIYMTHGSGRETFYAHLNGFAVANGTRVKAGQLIGYVGSTGASTGPHLHFSYRKNGAWINPRPLIYTPSTPAPMPPSEPTTKEKKEMAKNIGHYIGLTRPKSASQESCVIYNPESGFYTTWSGVSQSYHNGMAKQYATGSFTRITNKHWAQIKKTLDQIKAK